MSNPQVTHLLDDAGDRLCCCEDSPAVAAPALLDADPAAGVVFCPSCARAVLATVVELAQSRCGDDPLLNIIHALTTAPDADEAAVLRLMAPSVTALADYMAGRP